MLCVAKMLVVGGLIGRWHHGGVPMVAPCECFETLVSPADTYFVGVGGVGKTSCITDGVLVRANLCTY